MGKYEPLGVFLRGQRSEEVPLTFDEIERITGVKLPPKAQHHRAWWSNNPSNNVMTKVWFEAGLRKRAGRHECAQTRVSSGRKSR